nr:EOG090X07WR [Eulimnadia texana]
MIAHGHYTVDIVIAYYVTTRLFWIYHTMANNAVLKVKHIVLRTGAMLRRATCKTINIAEVVYTLRDVVDEIRDQATRQRLQVLPYELKMIEPNVEAIKFITDFSKKTGDFASLSTTDIKVLALTYQLEIEAGRKDQLKTEPKMSKSVIVGRGNEPIEPVAGFYKPKTKNEASTSEPEGLENIEEKVGALSLAADDSQEETVDNGEAEEDYEEEEEEEVDEEEEEEEDGDNGWITPSNISKVKNQIQGQVEDSQLEVACITTDFAMQNVLVQVGMHIVSLDGKQIRQARTYILRCYACFKTTSNITKVFCPSCGHKTLKKVAVTLNEDGSLKIHISSRHRLTPRGKKFSLPTPKGGKYANNPILVEDQREAQKRATKLAMKKTNALDPDYIAGNSPFAMNDVYSRASMLGRTGRGGNQWNRRNPNEARKKKR